MSNYVEETLVSGETILYQAKTSFWSQLGLILGGFILIFAFGLGLLLWIVAFIRYKTTELSFTNRRVVAKIGLIGRQTIELNINKVESLQVSQGVFGRMFNYGTLIISGAGNPQAPISGISNPMGFRQAFMEYQNTVGTSAVKDRPQAQTETHNQVSNVNPQLPAGAKMFCSECGTSNALNGKFCSGCGAPLAQRVQA
jgi:uncharacterized membrane protein YdbT with pleckstrin-like domain